MNRLLIVSALSLLPLSLLAAPPAAAPAAKGTVKAVIKTSMGSVELELNSEKAPVTVANFIRYAKDGAYDKTVFHRVIKDFMIQGGGMDDKMKERPTRSPIRNESANGLQNLRGTIACARTSAPDSATSQFYINHKDNNSLDGAADHPGYTVFGKVVKGMDVLDKIASVPTQNNGMFQNVPVTPVYIESVSITE